MTEEGIGGEERQNIRREERKEKTEEDQKHK